MLKTDVQSRLYCAHYVPSNIDCPNCHSIEKDYRNRPLYAPLYVPLANLPNALDNSQLKLPNTFYVPLNARSNNQTKSNDISHDGYVEIKTKNGIVRVPRSTLVHRSSTCNAQQTFPGDFDKHAHRFTRSFSWKTKPEESSFAQMQPLPKLIKRPGYLEMCCKNICWPTHQLCLCCGRNTAESCRKWSKSTGEYDYMDACWSSCALCSDDAYKILNTPVVYNEKIIDPEVLLPLDAELLYYSIQSAKRQQEKQQNSSAQSTSAQQQPETPSPFTTSINDSKEPASPSKNQKSSMQPDTIDVKSQEKQPVTPRTVKKSAIKKKKQPRKVKSSKSKKSSQSKNVRKESRKKRRNKYSVEYFDNQILLNMGYNSFFCFLPK